VDEDGDEANAFISELLSSNGERTKFVGSKHLGEFDVVEGRIFAEADGRQGGARAEVPLDGVSGFEGIALAELKEGGEGLTTVYYPRIKKGGEKRAAFLASGVLRDNFEEGGWEVIETNEDGSVDYRGRLDFGDSEGKGIYLHGMPDTKTQGPLPKGDYVYHDPGERDNVIFETVDSIRISGAEGDVKNGAGSLVGFSNEEGARGEFTYDNTKLEIRNQNSISANIKGRVVGNPDSDNMIKVTDFGPNSDGLRVEFPKGVKDVDINNINEEGRGKEITAYIREGDELKRVVDNDLVRVRGGQLQEPITKESFRSPGALVLVDRTSSDAVASSRDAALGVGGGTPVTDDGEVKDSSKGELLDGRRVTSIDANEEVAKKEAEAKEAVAVDSEVGEDGNLAPEIGVKKTTPGLGGKEKAPDEEPECVGDDCITPDIREILEGANNFRENLGGKPVSATPQSKFTAEHRNYYETEYYINEKKGDNSHWQSMGYIGTSDRGDGYFHSKHGVFNGEPLDYATINLLKEQAGGGFIRGTVTAPTRCTLCVTELSGMSKDQIKAKTWITPAQARALGITGNGEPLPWDFNIKFKSK
jgi:hypothetical protein